MNFIVQNCICTEVHYLTTAKRSMKDHANFAFALQSNTPPKKECTEKGKKQDCSIPCNVKLSCRRPKRNIHG